MHPKTPDFRFPSRRGRLRIASYVMADATPQGKEKTSQRGHLLTEIATPPGARRRTQHRRYRHTPYPGCTRSSEPLRGHLALRRRRPATRFARTGPTDGGCTAGIGRAGNRLTGKGDEAPCMHHPPHSHHSVSEHVAPPIKQRPGTGRCLHQVHPTRNRSTAVERKVRNFRRVSKKGRRSAPSDLHVSLFTFHRPKASPPHVAVWFR